MGLMAPVVACHSSAHVLCSTCRKIAGPHICGESLDIDPRKDQILTGSWRKDNALQVRDSMTSLYLCIFLNYVNCTCIHERGHLVS